MTVTITLPGQSGLLLGELPEYAQAVASFRELIDQVDLASPRRVPRRVVAALDQHREDLAELGRLRLGLVSVRQT